MEGLLFGGTDTFGGREEDVDLGPRSDDLDLDLQLTASQLQTLRIIAISAACLSLATGLVVGYWFVRMKRSFRHHLIMLLVFSDFWKATWQLTFPAVEFSGRGVQSEDFFCQASGFSMSLGIEASDFASVVIAIHSALYIFRPSNGAGDGGLYRYRHYVYAIWLLFPFLMASLAFINKPHAYTVQETFCYLPPRPHWPRQALAWIPRYVFMLTIFVLYASVYIYVRLTFSTFRTNVGQSTLELDTVENITPPEKKQALSPMPHQLNAHGLIPESSTPRGGRARQSENSSRSDRPFARAQTKPGEKQYLSPSPEVDEPGPSHSFDGTFDFMFGRHRAGSCVRSSTEEGTESPRESLAEKEMRRQRLTINKQLRLLFIYPVVYVAMWLLPLVHQALQTAGYFHDHHAFPLKCFVAFTVPAQCAIDCWLFTVREQPWKSITGNKSKSFWNSFCFWQVWGDKGEVAHEDTHWRNNKFLSPETRHAYERRDAELKAASEKWLRGGQRGGASDYPGSPPRSARLGTADPELDRDLGWWNRLEEVALDEAEAEAMARGAGDGYSNAENGYGPVPTGTPGTLSPVSPVSPEGPLRGFGKEKAKEEEAGESLRGGSSSKEKDDEAGTGAGRP